MSQTQLIDISFILDRSGSMEAVREATITGFNHFLSEQRQIEGEAHLTLVQFDDQYELVHQAIPLNNVPMLDASTFVPRGTTALLDAIGRTVNATGTRLAQMPESDRPDQVLCVILTDGYENASREFSRRQIFEMIRHQQQAYNWQFVFLGADQDAIATARSYGIKPGSSMKFASTDESTREVMFSLSEATSRFRHRRQARSDSYFDNANSKHTPSASA